MTGIDSKFIKFAGRWVLAVCLQLYLALACLMPVPASAVAPLAGSYIDNRAMVTYFDTDLGYNSTLYSNTVRVQVQALEALTLSSSQDILRPAGGMAVISHRLTNTGNVASVYTLNYANLASDGFDLTSLTMVNDANANGVADTVEVPIANGATVMLAPGKSLDVVIWGMTPSTVPAGATAGIRLTASTALQNMSAANTDTITVANGAMFQLAKAASEHSATPGDTVTFSLTASNTGNKPATGIPVVVDDAANVFIIVRDVVPVNTTFVSLTSGGGAVGLYHELGAPEHAYRTTPPTDLKRVDAVAFAYTAIGAGQSYVRTFSVKVNTNASGVIQNVARVIFNNGVNATPESVNSNPVQLEVPNTPPAIRYYRDAAYTKVIRAASTGQVLYVQADAAQCNSDPLEMETKRIIITSAITSDMESYLATETGVNTGQFRIIPNVKSGDGETSPATPGDGILTSKKGDKLTATLQGCGQTQVQVELLIDPYGVVFDSKTNATIPGATVTLIDVTGEGNGGRPGRPAKVFKADGATTAPSTVVTDANGRYEFPTVLPSTYKLVVTPPGGFSFPTTLAAALLPPGRAIDLSGSYGGNFLVNLASGPVHIDIPVDASSHSGLFIEKTAARTTVEIGEFMDYTIRVKNTSGQLLGRVLVTDTLPAGFAYQPGSARINDDNLRFNLSTLPEPDGGTGPKLVFNIGSIEDQAVSTLSYRVRIGPGALRGDGINRAQAQSAGPLVKISNIASVTVQVLPGVFGDDGFLLGKVYADCNANGVQDDGEPGVPGVRLLLEDGTHVTTDGEGKYSLYGLSPRTHVLKLDNITLPQGAQLEVLSQRNAGNPGSRFVDIKNGELHRADFAIEGCNVKVMREIRTRAAAMNDLSETETALKTRMSANPTPLPLGDVKALPASGLINRAATPQNVAATAKNASNKTGKIDADGALSDEQIAEMDNTLMIITPRNEQVLPFAQTRVIVKGVQGAKFTLRVNGDEIGEERVGKRSALESKELQVWEYIGISLVPGKNTLELTQYDDFGNARGRHGITVLAPGKLGAINIEGPGQSLPADGKTPVKITLSLADADGVPMTARTPVTLESSAGVWKVRDLDDKEPGIQIFVEGGKADLDMESPREPGEIQIMASAGSVKGRASLTFVPELRPMIASGIIEGAINLRRLDTSALVTARKQDGFEQELRNFSRASSNGKAQAGVRAAMYLKGKVLGEYLLTMAYDSDKNTRERLFRDIQPDKFYPVYGDASIKGFDAQTTGPLYVRVDQGKSHVLYGDFNTQSLSSWNEARVLSRYNRSLTGVKAHQEDGLTNINVFASQDNLRSVVENLPAKGISGPYLINNLPFIQNSEKVEIITRDRNQNGLILKTVPLVRFSDYEIENLTGRLLFKAPIPSFDADLNPNFIRVTYEVEQGGEKFWVYGADGHINIGDSIKAGGSLVKDNNPQNPSELKSVNVVMQAAERTKVIAELAQTEKAGIGTGNATNFEVRHEGDRFNAQARIARSDLLFDNPSSPLAKGRAEAGAKLSYKIGENNTLKGEYLSNEDISVQSKREGAQVALEHSFTSNLRGEIGVRATHVDSATATTAIKDTASMRARLAGQVPGLSQVGVFGEYEQDVNDSDKRMAALGGDYRLSSGGRLYIRHELISSLGNQYALNPLQQRNATVVGMDTDYMRGGHVFSEYRLRDALAGREAQAAVGLRNQWRLGAGINLHTGFERTHSLDGNAASESMAITSAIDYTSSPLWKGSARLELRSSASSDSLLSTQGLAYKLNDEWTFLGRNTLNITKGKGVADTTQDRMQMGLAYRDHKTNLLNALFRIEQRYEKSGATTSADTLLRNVSIVSSHVNYQPSRALQLSGRYAGKWASETSNRLESTNALHLLSARAIYEFAKRWDAGLNAFSFFSNGFRSHHFGAGPEVGYRVMDNLWVAGGYNFFGYTDKDLAGADYTNPGAYLRLRFKFDETTF